MTARPTMSPDDAQNVVRLAADDDLATLNVPQLVEAAGVLETEDRVDGDLAGGAFSISRYSRGRLVAVEAVNMPQAYIAAQHAIQRAG